MELDLNRNCKNSSQTPNRIICECKDLSQKVNLRLADDASIDYDYVFISCKDVSLNIDFVDLDLPKSTGKSGYMVDGSWLRIGALVANRLEVTHGRLRKPERLGLFSDRFTKLIKKFLEIFYTRKMDKME